MGTAHSTHGICHNQYNIHTTATPQQGWGLTPCGLFACLCRGGDQSWEPTWPVDVAAGGGGAGGYNGEQAAGNSCWDTLAWHSLLWCP
jgi:hypothetical protein